MENNKSEIKCLVCKGNYFRKGYYEVDVNVDVHSTAYNDVNARTRSYDDVDVDVDVDVDTTIYNETTESGDIGFTIESEEDDDYGIGEYSDIYKYVCEDCGYIMSFTKEKNVESKHQERKRKEKENTYDWTNFGR